MGDGVSERLEGALRTQLERGCEQGVFPGAQASVSRWEGRAWATLDVFAGRLEPHGDPVTSHTMYDLASLTKPVVATLAVRLHQRGRFPLDHSVAAWIPEARDLPIGAQPWERVLSHRSGLVAWEAFFERLPEPPGSDAARHWILTELLPRWNEQDVGTSLYSDLGYILAGFALERAMEQPLDALVRTYVTVPLGLDEALLFGARAGDGSWVTRCAPTGRSPWRARPLRGEVHDDNCAALGGVAGHAGMFGTSRAVAAFGASCVSAHRGRRGALEEEAIRFATAPRPGGSHRLGWDGKSHESSSAGTSIDEEAFGHLGFTGTSLWCDPRRDLVIALLTNRVAVSEDNSGIRAFRPSFHDAVVDAFDGA